MGKYKIATSSYSTNCNSTTGSKLVVNYQISTNLSQRMAILSQNRSELVANYQISTYINSTNSSSTTNTTLVVNVIVIQLIVILLVVVNW